MGGLSLVSGSGGNEVIEKSKAEASDSWGGGAILPLATGKMLGVRLYCVPPPVVMFRSKKGIMEVVTGSKLKTVEVVRVSVSEPCDHCSVSTVVKGSKDKVVGEARVNGGNTMLHGGSHVTAGVDASHRLGK